MRLAGYGEKRRIRPAPCISGLVKRRCWNREDS